MGKKEHNKTEEILARYFSGEYPDHLEKVVQDWLASDKFEDEKAAALKKIFDQGVDYNINPSDRAYELLADLHRRAGITRQTTLKRETPAVKRIPFYRSKPLIRTAVSVAAAVVIIVGTFLLVKQADNLDMVQVATVKSAADSLGTQKGAAQPQMAEKHIEAIEGVQKEALLADGTRVWVNSGSSLTYPEEFASGERRVTLKGEAFFEVEHDAAMPFTVHTDHLDVMVLGTTFNVAEQAAANMTVVTLHEGSVEVTARNRSERLTPGDRLTYHHESGAMEVERFTALTAQDWRSQTIFADDKSMPEILRMVGNYYDMEVDFGTVSFPAELRYVAGFDKTDSAKKVLDMLVEISGNSFSYERQNDTIKIYGRK